MSAVAEKHETIELEAIPTQHNAPAVRQDYGMQTQQSSPASLLQIAVSRGASMEELERLMALQERHEANEARKAYVRAMAQFKQNPPEIIKDKKVGYESKDGTGFVGYTHASIGNITTAIVEGLAKHGFSHRWDTKQVEGGQIVVTCVITHELGHSESTTLQSSRDDSGKKNNIQAMASTVTYLQRYTLLSATGLATKDQVDDDGGSSESKCEYNVQNFIDEAKKFTKDALCLQYWNEHKAKFADYPAEYKQFTDEVKRHRAFIKAADKE